MEVNMPNEGDNTEGPNYNFDFTIPLNELEPVEESPSAWSPFAPQRETGNQEELGADEPTPDFKVSDWQPPEWNPPAWEPAVSNEEISKEFVPVEFIQSSSSAQERVRNAIDAAIEVSSDQQGSELLLFNDISDHHKINFIDDIDQAKELFPWIIYTDNPDDYRDILNAHTKYLDAESAEHNGMRYADYAFEHELEHLEGIRQMDPNARYSLQLEVAAYPAEGEDETKYALNFQPSILPVKTTMTKIGFALQRVYPTTPSEGDILAIHNMGYESPEEVIERARRYNDQGLHLGRPYPVPKWYRDKE
jgi:hypothetical protein